MNQRNDLATERNDTAIGRNEQDDLAAERNGAGA
ncbi:hypothetical protein P3T27_007749 [Kitasatospora sp. MAA19]|nr:hypothetical protein [Kitasatospora sp. MAA19]